MHALFNFFLIKNILLPPVKWGRSNGWRLTAPRYLKLEIIESITISINIIYNPIIGFDCIKCALNDFYFLKIYSTTVTTALDPVGSKNRKKNISFMVNSGQWTDSVHCILISIFKSHLFSCHELTLVNLYSFSSLFIIGSHCGNHIFTNYCRVVAFENRYITVLLQLNIGKFESMI